MKYLKIIKEDSNYNFYMDSDIITNTNLITTDTHPAGALKLFKGLKFTGQKYIDYMWTNRTIATNKKDLTNQNVIANNSAVVAYNPTRRYKIVNNKLFVVDSSGGVTNITDNINISTYTDVCYYNGYYYLVKGNNKIYSTEDFITFDTYITTDNADTQWKFITNIGSKFYCASGGSWNYSDIKIWRIKSDGTTVMLTQSDKTMTSNQVGHLDTIGNNVVAIAQYSNSYVEVFRNIQDDGTCDTYASDIYSDYYNNLSYDEINNELYYSVSNKVIKFNFSNNTFSYYTVSNNYSTIPLYHKFNGNLIGTNCTLNAFDSNSKKLDDGSIVYGIDSYDNDYCKVKVLPALNYKLDSVTSLNGTVTFDEQEAIIEYASTDLYIEDTITASTSFNLFVPSGDYELTSISTSDFESDEFSNSFIYYEGTVISIDKMKAENNKFYVRDALSNEWFEIFDGTTLTWKTGSNVFMLGENVTNVSNGVKTSFENGTQVNPIINYTVNVEESDFTSIKINKGYKLNIQGNHYFIVDRDNFNIELETNRGYSFGEVTSSIGSITQTIDVNNMYVKAKVVLNGLLENEVTIIYTIDSYKIKFILYTNTSDIKEINKTLTNETIIYGQFVENVSLNNPSILLEYNLKDLITYNYCYIPDLERYYFISNPVAENTIFTRVNTEEDVLMTASSEIKNTKADILRSSTLYDNKLIDSLIPKKTELSITETELANLTTNGFKSDLSDLKYNVTVTLVSGEWTTDTTSTYTTSTGTYADDVLPHFSKIPNTNIRTFVLYDYNYLAIFMSWLNTIEGANTYFISAKVYPFSLLMTLNATNYNGIVNNGTPCTHIGYNDGSPHLWEVANGTDHKPAVMVESTTYFQYAQNTFNTFTSYLDTNAKYELYVPYAGWIELNSQQINGKLIHIYYEFDLDNGNANISITDDTSDKLIYSNNINVAIDIPSTFDNNAENNRKKDNLMISSALGMIGGIIATGAGIASYNPVAVAGGVLSMAKVGANYFQAMDSLFTRANCSIGSTYIGLFMPNKCRLRITKEVEQYSTDWIKANGKPVQKYDTISNYSGFIQADLKNVYFSKLTKAENDRIKSLLLEGIYLTVQ